MALWQPALSCRGSEPWLSGVWAWPNPYPSFGGFPCPPIRSWQEAVGWSEHEDTAGAAGWDRE